jgi:hypothetical protein
MVINDCCFSNRAHLCGWVIGKWLAQGQPFRRRGLWIFWTSIQGWLRYRVRPEENNNSGDIVLIIVKKTCFSCFSNKSLRQQRLQMLTARSLNLWFSTFWNNSFPSTFTSSANRAALRKAKMWWTESQHHNDPGKKARQAEGLAPQQAPYQKWTAGWGVRC